MSKVTDYAKALGEAIVASDEYKNMQVTENAAMSDKAVTDAMARYMELKQQLGDVMCNEEPDPELMAKYSQEMDEVQQQLNEMEPVVAMTQARQQFSELMNQVNQIMEFTITGELPQQSGSCSGNCSGCSGCH